jgi:signal peptidase I
MDQAEQPKRPSGLRSLIELVVIVAAAMFMAWLIQAVLIKPYMIPSGSMLPTLQIGERILAERVTYHFSEPEIGQIVVFHPPINVAREEQDPPYSLPLCSVEPKRGQACAAPGREPAKITYIKRIIAGPGDTVWFDNGIPYVNDQAIIGDWETEPCSGDYCDLPTPVRVPEGHYYVLGDNRGGSEDSRYWGPLPEEWIVGQAVWTYWPISDFGPIK